MNYVGIDLHSNNSYMVIADQAGRRVFENQKPRTRKGTCPFLPSLSNMGAPPEFLS